MKDERKEYMHEQEHFHISNFLVSEFGYSDDDVDIFWSNIGGLVEIDYKERFAND